MIREMRTAVAAAAAEQVRNGLMHAMAGAGVTLLALESNPADALRALQELCPDLLIADQQLPLCEGAQLLERALRSRLPVRPAGILLCSPEYAAAHLPSLEEMGVIRIPKPLSAAALASAAGRLAAAPPFFSDQECRAADALLDALGFAPGDGRRCLKTAALLCSIDRRYRVKRRSRLCPDAAALCGMTAAQAQRSMRRAISLAWQGEKIESQSRIFTDAFIADRGFPSCGEMISRLADILRLEGSM